MPTGWRKVRRELVCCKEQEGNERYPKDLQLSMIDRLACFIQITVDASEFILHGRRRYANVKLMFTELLGRNPFSFTQYPSGRAFLIYLSVPAEQWNAYQNG